MTENNDLESGKNAMKISIKNIAMTIAISIAPLIICIYLIYLIFILFRDYMKEYFIKHEFGLSLLFSKNDVNLNNGTNDNEKYGEADNVKEDEIYNKGSFKNISNTIDMVFKGADESNTKIKNYLEAKKLDSDGMFVDKTVFNKEQDNW